MRREQLFFDAMDYLAFERVLMEALERVPIRLLAYCVMPNHWHLVVWPQDEELPRFMHWLTMTHAKRWHHARGSAGTGSVYQNRYYAVPVQKDAHCLAVLRYVERNPLRGRLVERAEDWRWSSLWRRCNSCEGIPLAAWPIPQPERWIETVNQVQTRSELQTIQAAVRRGLPIGDPEWSAAAGEELGLSIRAPGRPPKRHRV